MVMVQFEISLIYYTIFDFDYNIEQIQLINLHINTYLTFKQIIKFTFEKGFII